MTKQKALFQFFSGFGIKAYPSNAVPDDVKFPWMTYEVNIAEWEKSVSVVVNLWYHTESETAPNAKAEEIYQAIGLGGVTVPCDGGALWIKRGNPFCQNMADQSDSTVKRRYILLDIEYLTI